MRLSIKLENIQKSYAKTLVLNISSLEIYHGELVAITGANGCGKSTLLKILALLDKDYQGSYYYNGEKVDYKNSQLSRKITMLLQEPYLLAENVYNNIAYPLKIRQFSKQAIQEQVKQAMEAVALDYKKFAKRRRYELSGGEKQRVALAARLVIKPELLLLDEATANVDKKSADLIAKAICSLNAEGTTIITVSHDQNWLEQIRQMRHVQALSFKESNAHYILEAQLRN